MKQKQKYKAFTQANIYKIAKTMPKLKLYDAGPCDKKAILESEVFQWLASKPELASYIIFKLRDIGAFVQKFEKGGKVYMEGAEPKLSIHDKIKAAKANKITPENP